MSNPRIIVTIPHSHSWLWTQTCVAMLQYNPPQAAGYDVSIMVVDNSPWSPAIRGITNTAVAEGLNLSVIPNHKGNRFHASALDCIVEDYEFDYLLAMETDVLVLRPDWLQWFINQMMPTDYAVGMWHHEQFVNPSCTLYRGHVLRDMMRWCKEYAPQDELRWGPRFELSAPLDEGIKRTENPARVLEDMKAWIAGPFAEKRGWPSGTTLKEPPSGQLKSGGWYEPGQQLHHWAVNEGYTYTVCPSATTKIHDLPVQTFYGWTGNVPEYQLEPREMMGAAETVHLWGGTRALDILKHDVTCEFVKKHTSGWLAREARFWKALVPEAVRTQTLELIHKYGFHITGQGNDIPGGNVRDREAAKFVKACYRDGGVEL